MDNAPQSVAERVEFLERVARELLRREYERLGPVSRAAQAMLYPSAGEEELTLRALGLWRE
ncbi:MAG: hypothetical protein E6R03_06380 [Hyphomicrobiaceae bacterium]|nr:MAG: hypothetical protein E6R03_06380 [Hyphomicrobiaceae bacterium]